jgi:hypothetical protein
MSVGRAVVWRLALKAAELKHRAVNARLRDAWLAVLAFRTVFAQLSGGL